MAEFEWPDDPEFRRVAARIADAVTVAINSGKRIVPASSNEQESPETYCPIGCIRLDGVLRHPPGAVGSWILRIPSRLVWNFMRAFDGGRADEDCPYAQLGLAYRERFVR